MPPPPPRVARPGRRSHQRIEAPRAGGVDHLLPGDRIDSGIRQIEAGELPAAHAQFWVDPAERRDVVGNPARADIRHHVLAYGLNDRRQVTVIVHYFPGGRGLQSTTTPHSGGRFEEPSGAPVLSL